MLLFLVEEYGKTEYILCHKYGCKKPILDKPYYYVDMLEAGRCFYHKECLLQNIRDEIKDRIKMIRNDRNNGDFDDHLGKKDEVRLGIEMLNFIYKEEGNSND